MEYYQTGKMQYLKFLNDLFNLSSDSEHLLHHEYSPSATAEDWVYITDIHLYIKERMNLFSSTKSHDIVNIAAGILNDAEEMEILIECIFNGNKTYSNFVKIR